MGQGGGLQLLNGTKYDWLLTDSQPGEMNSWPLPAAIRAGESVVLYVEWPGGGAATASTTYALRGTTLSFNVLASNLNLSATDPSGATINLGWQHDGDVYYLLAGEEGSFSTSTIPTASWLQDNLPMLGRRTLRQLCLTGSHDSGMSSTSNAFIGCQVLTQSVPVLGQLQTGARYFDIRPVLAGGQYATGHYTGSLGANGQSIASIISDVNTFTAANAELIILFLSHDTETDTGFGAFNQDQWNALLENLTQIRDLFVLEQPANVDLSLLTLNDYIGQGRAAVLVIVAPNDSSITLGTFANRGFYTTANYNLFNNFADSDSVAVMAPNQYGQMQQQRTSPDSPLFLLSWTLTQTTLDAIFGPCISALAAEANPVLQPTLLRNCSSNCFPNVLYTDYVFPNLTASAMFVNALTNFPRLLEPPFALAATSDALSIVFRTANSRLWVSTAAGGTQWGAPVELPDTINSLLTPAATAWNGGIAVFFHGQGQDATLWFASQQNDWNDLRQQPLMTTPASPALAVMNGRLFTIFLSNAGDGTLFGASSGDGQTWTAPQQLPPELTTNFPVSIASMDGNLYILFRSSGDNTIWMFKSPDGISSVELFHLPPNCTTLTSPALASLDGSLYAAFNRDTDETLWVAKSVDAGNNWTPTQIAGASTVTSPAIAVLGDQIWVLFAAASDNSVWQTSSPNGVTWSPPLPLPVTLNS